MNLDDIVQSTITRESPVASLPGFGTPALLAQFATSKTKTAFTRGRYYASTSEMTADNWASTDSVYQAAAAIFSQNPRVPRVFVGRIDSGDASVAASGDAIRAEQDDWYTFEVVGNRSAKFVLSADLITGNVLSSTINGTTVPPVTYATSHANTMSLWKTAIEAAITGATATISGREMTVAQVGKDMNIATASVASGASQPTIAITYPLDATKTKAWMAWTMGQKKAMGFQDSDPAMKLPKTGNASTACLSEYAKLQGNTRIFSIYHGDNTEYAISAWVGKELPQSVGSKLWAFTNLSGISADSLTSGEIANIRAKCANIYTTTANYSHTYSGVLANGVQIDQLRGTDWLDSNIKLAVFNLMASTKLTITDPGYQLLYGTILAELLRGEDATVLVSGTSSVFVPLAADVPEADRAAGIMSGTTWDSKIQVGALEVAINGTVSV